MGAGNYGNALGAGFEGTLTVYQSSFVVIVLGGGFYALANLMYYALVIMRRQRAIFIVYLVAAATAALISGPLVSRWEIAVPRGYLILMIGLTAGFGICTVRTYERERGESWECRMRQ